MKIIQVPFCFYPDPVGGTEVYVEALAQHLKNFNVDVSVAAPGNESVSYVHNGIKVNRFGVFPSRLSLRDFYGQGDPLAAQSFAHILNKEKPDIVHLHAFTSGVSVKLIEEAKKRKIRVFFTYHTPTVSCQQGTLIRWGKKVCDGKLRLGVCSACTLHGLGLNKNAAWIVGHLPKMTGRMIGRLGFSGRFFTALRMTELVELKHHSFRKLVSQVDHIIAVSQWVKDVLIINGAPLDKITLCRQGVGQSGPQDDQPRYIQNSCDGIKLIFLGRSHPNKGIDLLIKAMQLKPTLKIKLDIYGVSDNDSNGAYINQLQQLAKNDFRISFCKPVNSDRILHILKQYDFLMVPSLWLETGPLVVFEAFAAGLPVIGSDRGGIAELVKDGRDGLLVDPDSISAWAAVLQRVHDDPDLRERLRFGVVRPRTMREVAEQMMSLYLQKLQVVSNINASE